VQYSYGFDDLVIMTYLDDAVLCYMNTVSKIVNYLFWFKK